MLDYFNTAEGLNVIVTLIIIIFTVNSIFVLYGLSSYNSNVKKQKEEIINRKLQEEKIDRLYPHSKKY